MKKNKSKKFILDKDTIQLFLLSLPAIISLFLFAYMPMGGLLIAFKDIDYSKGILGSDWNGLDNFMFFFESQYAWRTTRNTIFYNLIFIVIGLSLAVIIAMMLYSLARKWVKLYQTILFFPYFLSWVIIAYLVYIFLNPTYGVIGGFIETITGTSVNLYSEPGFWPPFLIFMHIWKMIGYNAIIFYTGLLSIDKALYEAAEIDGASGFQQKIYITIPQLKSLIIIMTVLAVGKIMFADFGLFYMIPRDSGILYEVTDVIDTYVFRALRVTGDIGMSAAASFFQSIVGFLLVLTTNLVIRKVSPEDAIF